MGNRIKINEINLKNTKIPIFIITKDRLTVLKKTIDSYNKYIKTPFEIIIHDNGTTFKKTLDYLKYLEEKNIKVYYYKQQKYYSKIDLLNRVNDSIDEYFKTNNPPYYCVTDPDVAFYNKTPGDILEFYATLLEKYYPKIKAVGPIMKINDIPKYYPFKQMVINKYKKLHYSMPCEKILWKNKHTWQFYFKRLESTFAMYKSNFKFQLYKKAIRTHFPCDAKHLDWYVNPNKLNDDQIYYAKHYDDAPFTGHWAKEYLRPFVVGKQNALKMNENDKKIKLLAKKGNRGIIK